MSAHYFAADCDCGLAANRTRIQGFGDPYTIHCTTRPNAAASDAQPGNCLFGWGGKTKVKLPPSVKQSE